MENPVKVVVKVITQEGECTVEHKVHSNVM